jgi:hypothetical protein
MLGTSRAKLKLIAAGQEGGETISPEGEARSL